MELCKQKCNDFLYFIIIIQSYLYNTDFDIKAQSSLLLTKNEVNPMKPTLKNPFIRYSKTKHFVHHSTVRS